MKIMKGHRSEITSISISPDDKFIASSSGDKTIKIWDTFKGKDL